MTIGKTEADYYRHRISVIKLLRRFIMSHVKRNKNEKKKRKPVKFFDHSYNSWPQASLSSKRYSHERKLHLIPTHGIHYR